MIRKLFCKHEYEYFHKDRYYSFPSAYPHDQYHYVCKKCEKTSVIQERALEEFLIRTSKKVKKEEALGVDNSQYEDLNFNIAGYITYGKLSYYTQKRLHRYRAHGSSGMVRR